MFHDCGLVMEIVFAIDQNIKDLVGSYDYVHVRTKGKGSFWLTGYTLYNKGKLVLPRYQSFIVVLNRLS